jgi:hypothetical protein
VVHHICSVLAHLDADGTPLTAGVTLLDGVVRAAPPNTAPGGAAVGDTLS